MYGFQQKMQLPFISSKLDIIIAKGVWKEQQKS